MGQDLMSSPLPLEYQSGATFRPSALLAALLLKLLAIYFAIQAWMGLMWSISFVATRSLDVQTLSYTGALVVGNILPAALLFWKADRWGPRLLRSGGESCETAPINTTEAQAIAFSVVGVYLACNALPDVGRNLFFLYQNARLTGNTSAIPETIRLLIGDILMVALGAFLFLRSRGLALLWHRIRTGGVRQRENRIEDSDEI
jgi:hypothetical protein